MTSAERIVNRFLIAAGLPNRVDLSVVKMLVADLKRLTKIYRDLPTKLEENPETHEQSYKFADQWEETERLFNQFRTNVDEWVYKVLIQHAKPEKDSWAQRDVREKAWSFLGEVGSSRLLPTAWNYKTDKHEIAPWELEKKRDANIQRYQKRFRDFMVALEALIQAEGGTVERLPAFEQFSIAGMNVVLHAVDREERGKSFKDFGYEPFLHDLGRQAQEVIRAGFRKAVEGLTVHLQFQEHGLIGGEYNAASDTLTIYALGQSAGPKATTFIHETGHRFYYRVMTHKAREHWDDVMQSRTVKITQQDVDSFVSDVYKTQTDEFITDRDLMVQIDRSPHFDPETKAKYRFLADHNPAYVRTPEGVAEHHRKFNLGENATLEHITDYGAESPVEAFAEAFQLYVRKGPSGLGPWTRWFFEEITHSGRQAAIERIAARYKDKKKTDAGNTVYMYSERQIANRNKAKAERIQKLRGGIEKLRTKVKKDLKSKDLETARTALAVALMDHTYERVGNEESAGEGHYGVTGWQRKHVSFSGSGATIKYVGKSGVKHEKKVTDAAIRSALKDAYDSMKGDDTCLLEWKDGKVTAEKVNAYLEPFDITAKDIRGLHANEEMRVKLKAVRAKKKLPEDKKEREKQLKDEFKEALEQTAECVGHEPSTLKSQYLVPGLEESFLKDGTIIDKLGSGPRVLDLNVKGLVRFKQRGNPIELEKSGYIDGRYIDGTDDEHPDYPFAWQEALKESLQKHGLREPIEFTAWGGRPHITEGHHRLTAALELGWRTIPVRVDPSVSDEMLVQLGLITAGTDKLGAMVYDDAFDAYVDDGTGEVGPNGPIDRSTNQHYQVVCRNCGSVIRQCRCYSPDKVTLYEDSCSNCRPPLTDCVVPSRPTWVAES